MTKLARISGSAAKGAMEGMELYILYKIWDRNTSVSEIPTKEFLFPMLAIAAIGAAYRALGRYYRDTKYDAKFFSNNQSNDTKPQTPAELSQANQSVSLSAPVPVDQNQPNQLFHHSANNLNQRNPNNPYQESQRQNSF